jgi:hypothetical protein
VTRFANRPDVANLAYWVTGTEGSNPSLSAIESQIEAFFGIHTLNPKPSAT